MHFGPHPPKWGIFAKQNHNNLQKKGLLDVLGHLIVSLYLGEMQEVQFSFLATCAQKVVKTAILG